MEQRKIELVSNCGKLENECQVTNHLLTELLNKNARAVNDVNNLTNNELLKNADIFLNVSKQIYNTIHKVMTINLDLENFISTYENCGANNPIPFQQCESETEILSGNNTCDSRINEPLSSQKSSSDAYLSLRDFDEQSTSLTEVKDAQTESELSTSNRDSNGLEEPNLDNEKSSLKHKLAVNETKPQMEKYIESLPKVNVHSQSTLTDYKSVSNGSIQSSNNVKISGNEDLNASTDSPQSNFIALSEYPTPNMNDLCVLSSYVSPSEFYINVCNEDTASFDSMANKLADYGKKTHCKFNSKEHAKTYITKYCLVYCEDWEQWYRAEIIDWLDNDDTMDVEIQLVDYGDYKRVPVRCILVLPQPFCVYPKLAIRCHFACLYPPGSTDTELKMWPHESLTVLSNAIENVETIYRLVFIDKNENSLAIDMIDVQEQDEEKTLGQIMIDMGHAVQILNDPNKFLQNDFIKQQLKTAQGMAGLDDSMTPHEQLDKFFSNLEINEPTTISEALALYDAQDEARTCRFARPDGTCFKGYSCKLDHKPLRKDGYTTDTQATYTSAFNQLPVQQTGNKLEMVITFVCSINQFYAQIRNFDPDAKKLKQLLNQMNQSKKIANYKSFKILPALGELVLAQYVDNKWYRAMVREIYTDASNPDIVVQVFFVDFGDVLDVQLRDIRQMQPEFLDLPFQAVRCSINNIERNRNISENDAKEYFESKYLCNNIKAIVVYPGPSFLDVLISKKDNFDIGMQLIEDGYAQFRKDFLPKYNEVLLVD